MTTDGSIKKKLHMRPFKTTKNRWDAIDRVQSEGMSICLAILYNKKEEKPEMQPIVAELKTRMDGATRPSSVMMQA